MLDEFTKGLSVSPKAVKQARLMESAALEEHIRILRIFTDLTVHGRIPKEE